VNNFEFGLWSPISNIINQIDRLFYFMVPHAQALAISLKKINYFR